MARVVDASVDWCKRVWLNRVVGYKNPQRYWDRRWSLRLIPGRTDYTGIFKHVNDVMAAHECKTVLEIGPGRTPLSALPGYTALDFSRVALDQSGLKNYIYADITDRIPLPSKSFDALYSGNVLLHIPPGKIGRVAKEYKRVARKCLILNEPITAFESKFNCYYHDLDALFGDFQGSVVYSKEIMGVQDEQVR